MAKKFSNLKIEARAITALRCLLDRSKFLDHYIAEHDTGPSWDGEIILYSDESFSKEYMSGRIPIQIKGKTVDILSYDAINYPIEVADLKNYRNDGGVFYFVVEQNGHGVSKIFYKSMLPADLNMTIRKLIKNQKKKTIELKHFNFTLMDSEKNIQKMELLFKNFLMNRNLQSAETEYIKHWDGETNLQMVMSSNAENIFDDLVTGNFNLYECVPNTKILQPFDMGRVAIDWTIPSPILIDGEVIYESYEIVPGDKSGLVKIGNGIKIFSNEHRYEYDFKGSLRDRIRDTRFLKHLISGEDIILGTGPFAISVNDKAKQMKALEDYENNLNEARKVFEFFNLDDTLSIDSWTDTCYGQILLLAKILEDPSSYPLVIINEGIQNFIVANLTLTVRIEKDKNGHFTFLNFYSEEVVNNLKITYKNGEVFENAGIFLAFKKEDLLNSDNVDYKLIVKTIIIDNWTKQYLHTVTTCILTLIDIYDTNGDVRALEAAEKLSEWVFDCDDLPESYINYIQIKKRFRKLDDLEIEKLIEVKNENSKNLLMQCAVYSLLGNKDEFGYTFKRMGLEDQELFLTFPLMRFMEEL